MTGEYYINKNNEGIYSLYVNPENYPSYRRQLLDDIRRLIFTEQIVFIENVVLEKKSSKNNKITDTKAILLFLSDIYSLMNRYPQNLSIGSKAIQLSSINIERISSEVIINILKLIQPQDKTGLLITEQKNGVKKIGQKDSESLGEHISKAYLNAEYELMQKGYRKAGKYECNTYAEAENINKILSQIFPFTEIVRNKQDQIDIYYSLKNNFLSEIINSDNIISDEHIKRSGWLFGYPECCTKEYLKSGFQYLPSFPYKWLIRRYQTGGQINPLFNPFLSNLYYFPCNLRCSPTLKRLKIISKHIISKDKMELLYMPLIFFLPPSLNPSSLRGSAGNMEFVPINPVSVKGNRIIYKPVNFGKETENSEIISKGDSLTLSDGIMTISKGERIIHRFVLGAGIWYYKKTFDNDFWKIFIRFILNFVRYRPVTLRKDIFDEDFIRIKSSLLKNTALFQKYNITVNAVNMHNNEITIDMEFEHPTKTKVILSVQRPSPHSKYFIKGRKYIISIRECSSKIKSSILYPLSALILNLIEN